MEEGQKQGLSERTLKRAKQDLGVNSAFGYRDGVKRSYWLLAGQELPAELRGPALSDAAGRGVATAIRGTSARAW